MTTATIEPKVMKLQPKRHAYTVQVRAEGGAADAIRFVIATERQASDGGVLIADGMDATEFLARPFVLLGHNPEEIFGKCTKLERTEDGWEAVVQRLSDAACSEPVKRWWAILNDCGFGAASIGFRCTDVDWEPKAEELAKYGATARGWIGRKWQLLEWSVLSVQADPGATMKSAEQVLSRMSGDERRAIVRAHALNDMRRVMRMEDTTMTDQTTGDGAAADAETDTALEGKIDAMVAALAELKGAVETIGTKLDAMAAEETTEGTEGQNGAEADSHADAILAQIEAELKAAQKAA